MKLAGVDGCRKGWIVALSNEWPCTTPVRIAFCPDFASVLEATRECLAIAIDIPIGLPEREPRLCDLEARAALGPQRSSIFLAPPRETLTASDPREFQARHRKLRNGAGAGLPVWGIVNKMLEVNLAFERDPDLQNRAFEFHPELTWKRLAQGRVLAPKKSANGILQRVALLNHHGGRWLPEAFEPIAGAPGIDDVLDAISGLASAHAFLHHPVNRIPKTGAPPRNAAGLRMEIWH